MEKGLKLKDKTILVTATTFGKCEPSPIPFLEDKVGRVIYNPFGRPLRSRELIDLVNEVDGWIAGLDEISEEVINAAKRLRVISRYGVGVDRVDIRAATKRGIVVTNTPGSNSVAVAEMTICLILALARNLIYANLATRKGEWPRLEGIGLKDKTVGIIGLGSIGREVAIRLNSFGCHVLAYDPFIDKGSGHLLGVDMVSLDDLLARSDFVTLHCSLTPETSGMVNETFLQRMKKGAFLINTARGELIDEETVLNAVNKGHLRGVALDCFTKEPPNKDNPLLNHPRVIVTPHMASHTDEAIARMSWMAMENCLMVLTGERPAAVVNPEVYGDGLNS